MVRVIVADDEFFARKALVKRLQEMSDEVRILAANICLNLIRKK